jgi:hypothetical protein
VFDVVLALEPVVAAQQLGGAAELVVEWHIVGAQQRPVVGLAVEAYCNMPMSWDPCLCFALKYPMTKRKLRHKCIWISVVQLVQILLITALCSVDNNLHCRHLWRNMQIIVNTTQRSYEKYLY